MASTTFFANYTISPDAYEAVGPVCRAYGSRVMVIGGVKAMQAACPELEILADSPRAGLYLAARKDGRQVFVTGHSEYDRDTLDGEYRRDLGKGLPIAPPENYYPGGDPSLSPRLLWRGHANLLFVNWLNQVYQDTPYHLEELEGF